MLCVGLQRLGKMSLLGSMLTLSSCATMTGSGVTDTDAKRVSQLLFCDGAKPVHWSTTDSDFTIRQARVHNAVGVDQCQWGKK